MFTVDENHGGHPFFAYNRSNETEMMICKKRTVCFIKKTA
jgi:hypothetical protein